MMTIEKVMYDRVAEQFKKWNDPNCGIIYEALYDGHGYLWEHLSGDEIDGVFFDCGATKGCFFYEDLPYVFKFNLYDSIRNDYCQMEYDNYLSITQQYPSLADMFTKCGYLGTFEGHEIYYSEKVTTDTSKVTTKGRDYIKYNGAPDSVNRCMDLSEIDAYCAVVDNYGLERTEDFYDLCDYYEINDLAPHNFGFREDGSICLFDYSGYFGAASYYNSYYDY